LFPKPLPESIFSGGVFAMLAEKFFLYLEALIKNQRSLTYTDGSPRVISSSRHVPVKLVERK
jgi:hypothetical protein